MGDREQENWGVLRAQAGDREALGELLKAVQEPLYRYVLSLVRERHLAEDVLQETLVRIYRKLGWLREPELFRPWAYRIATREAFRHLRRERQWAQQVRDEDTLKNVAVPPRDEFAAELADQLPQLIANIPPLSRAAVVLYYLHELSLGEVAAALDVPPGTVKSRLAYGRESLRRQLRRQQPLPDRGRDG